MTARNLFVQVDDPRLIGKVLDPLADPVPVEFFQSVRDREVASFPAASLQRAYLARQTRVYFPADHGQRWIMGRVIDYRLEDDGSVIYDVKAPNRIEYSVREQDLFARSYKGAGDPAEVLALEAAEAQVWHDARWSAREAVTRLRAAAGGLEGLVSASVELAPHQAAAVRRISQDPLQRYLLADEVGLGKTIEAAGVVRQCLLDDPRADVLILTPRTLVLQWKDELATKFGLGSENRVRVFAHEDASGMPTPSILVIDEAHLCVMGHADHAAIAQLAKATDKLLLLTATPLFDSQDAFLSLLKWLDPERWSGEDADDFRAHLEKSQEYGRLLLGLRGDAAPFLLRQRFLAAVTLFPGDDVVQGLAERFSKAETESARSAVAGELRDHIADVYRVHHRLLRARRSDLDGWEFQPREGATVREESHDEGDTDAVCAIVEDWRESALVQERHAADQGPALARRYRDLLACVGRGLAALRSLPPLEPLFDEEPALLAALREHGERADSSARRDFVVEVVRRQFAASARARLPTTKIVVFTSDQSQPLIDALSTALDDETLALGLSDLGQFQQYRGAAVLILDRGGEEGLNLHFADTLIHADMPLDVVRLEQRIGRLDRFGRTKGPIKHIVITPSGDDDTPWSTWLNWLAEGLCIFDRSTSDIQFVLSEVEAALLHRLLHVGGSEAPDVASDLKDRIGAERQKLDEQYALDQLALAPESARELVMAIEDGEADENELAGKVGDYLGLMQFGGRMNNDVFALAWLRETLLPEIPWRPVFESALRKPLTWRRRIALSRPDVSLLRPGAPLFEAVDRLLEWDDRGSAFATWRFRPGLGGPGEERLLLKLCWHIGPGDIAGTGLLADRNLAGLRRQAQEAMPPWTSVQYLDLSLRPTVASDLLSIAQQPYRKSALDTGGRDYNIGSRPDWLRRVIDPAAFSLLCGAVREEGLALIVGSEEYSERRGAAESAIIRAAERRRRRQSVRTSLGYANDEDQLADRLLEAVRKPEVRLDCIGLFVLAGYAPAEGRN